MGNTLDGGGAGTDDTDPFIRQTSQIAKGITAGIVIVPTAGMKRKSLEFVNTLNPWQLRPIQRAIGHGDITGFHTITTIGADDPVAADFIPRHGGHIGLKTGVVI